MTSQSLTAAEARRIALAAQGFAERRTRAVSGWPRIAGAVDTMGLLQLDSVNVLVRSHYLPTFSRAGPYDRGALDRRAFAPKRRALFEYWAHEASLLPLDLQPLLRWRMARAARGEGLYGSLARFAEDRRDYLAAVLREVRDRGPVSARELADPGARTGPWWGWNDGKTALECLFWHGEITTAERRGFERVYDVTERVIPTEVLSRPTPPEAEAQGALVAIAARALGIATEADLRDYFRLPLDAARQAVATLSEIGEIEPVAVAGWRQQAYLHRDAVQPARSTATALLSPFDPLVWERSRTERLFGFRYRLEIYTPVEKRRYGYYVLPFLHRGRLSARVDLKTDRAAGCLRVLAAHGEPGIDSGAVGGALAEELLLMAGWLGLGRVEVAERGNLWRSVAQRLARIG